LDRHGKGKEGEARAEEYLSKRGYRTVARNFRTRRGEVDLIVEKSGRLAFVEVKCWDVLGAEDLQYAIGARKQGRIRAVSRHFIWEHPEYSGTAVGYDVILVSPGRAGIRYYQDAFDGV
jgi:putative endonuclease